MDNLQAAILNFRLKLKEIIKRRFNYNIYKNNLPKKVFSQLKKKMNLILIIHLENKQKK